MSFYVMSCEMIRCNEMRFYKFVMLCGWLRCYVVWFEANVWGKLDGKYFGDLYYTDFFRII